MSGEGGTMSGLRKVLWEGELEVVRRSAGVIAPKSKNKCRITFPTHLMLNQMGREGGRGGKGGKGTYCVAIPLHRASMLSATRSPRRRCRAFPRTVATCLIGSNVAPSFMCHSTLRRRCQPSFTTPRCKSLHTSSRTPGTSGAHRIDRPHASC